MIVKFKNLYFLFALFSILAVTNFSTSCKKEEVDKNVLEDTVSTFSFLINGAATETVMDKHSLTHKIMEGRVFKQLDIVANSGANKLTLTAICGDFQNPPNGGVKTKKYFSNPIFATSIQTANGPLSDFGGAIWFVNSKSYVSSTSVNNSEFIEISSCDVISKKVSGKFIFTVKDLANANDSISILGEFKNQKYTVVN